MNKKKIIIAISIVIMAILIGVCCYIKFYQKKISETGADTHALDDANTKNETDSASIATQGITSSTVTGVQSEKTGWLSLADSFYGFSFLYPKNWSVSKYVDNNYASRIDAGQKAYTYWLFDENGGKAAIIFNEGQYGHGWPEKTDPVHTEFVSNLGRVVVMEGREHVSYSFSEFLNVENSLRVECTTSSQEIRNSIGHVVKSFVKM